MVSCISLAPFLIYYNPWTDNNAEIKLYRVQMWNYCKLNSFCVSSDVCLLPRWLPLYVLVLTMASTR